MRVPRKKIAALVAFVARVQGVPIGEVDIAVVSGSEIAAHNRRWMGRAGRTDVISFDLSDESADRLVAQLIVCGEVAAQQGPLRGTGPQRELLLYVLHGLLHLMGYDDTSTGAAAEMHAREEEILDEFLRV